LWTTLRNTGIASHIIHIAPLSLFVLVVISRDKTTRMFMTYLLACGVLLTLALGSHSAGQGDISLAVLADWLHLTAVSAWIGGLVAFVSIFTPSWRALPVEARLPWLASLVSRFSRMAIASVLIIIATGIYSARLEVPSWDALLGTLYGRTLDAKIVLFAILLVMGAIQLLWMRRRIGRSQTLEQTARIFGSFRRLIFAEVAVGIVTIGVAGFLTLIPPARSELSGIPTSPSPSTEPPSILLFGHPSPNLNLSLAISTSEREQSYDVLVTYANRQSPPDLLRVMLEFTLLDQDVGVTRVNLEPGAGSHYAVAGDYVPLPGMWRVRVVVRRKGVEDTASEFPYYVPARIGANATGDPEAPDWLEKSDAAMNQLTSLRSVQELNDGVHGEVTTQYEYQAPDRMRFQIVGEGESIAIGATQYYFEQGVWQTRVRVDPLVFPNFANARQVGVAKIGRVETLDGKAMQVVVGTDATSANAHYAYWIGTGDFRLYQFAMVAPAHFMMQSYSNYDAPVQIVAPVAK
jgi:copper transport protein